MTNVSVEDWNHSGEYLTYNMANTNAAAFETANGESVVVYYNPTCKADMQETRRLYIQSKICAIFLYDLNGSKGPNTVNKDIGVIGAIYPTDSIVVAPYPHAQNASNSVAYDAAARACTDQDSEYRMPNRYELMTLFAVKNLVGLGGAGYNTSSLLQVASENHAWRIVFSAGTMEPHPKSNNYALRCVKR